MSKEKRTLSFKVDKNTYEFLKMISKMSHKSINTVANDIIKMKLQELYEETYIQ